jgi:hypothetical protein
MLQKYSDYFCTLFSLSRFQREIYYEKGNQTITAFRKKQGVGLMVVGSQQKMAL